MFEWKPAWSGGSERYGNFASVSDRLAECTTEGIVSGTKLATHMGWRPVEGLIAGDKVLTFDNGMQEIVRIDRVKLWDEDEDSPRRYWPLDIPAGAFGNRHLMHLLSEQTIMVESDAAEERYGDPFALIPAMALEGINGISRVPPSRELEAITLQFEEEQVVFANSGALFLCRGTRSSEKTAFSQMNIPRYRVLPLDEALELAEEIEFEILCQTARPPASAANDVQTANFA